MHKKIEGAFLERFWVGLWAIRALTPDPFGSHFPSKMHPKINAKVDVEKVWKFMRKCSQNHAKTIPKIDDKSMTFWNLRFLVFFAKSITLKSFFHMIRGTRNQSKINQKSMQIPCSKKGCKNHEKCSKIDPKWEPKSRKC